MTFKKGTSGNAAGRPKGIPDTRSTLRGLLEASAPKLIQRAIELALRGDGAALRLCVERLIPALKTTDQPTKLPTLATIDDLSAQGREVIAALAAGSVTPDEAATLMQTIAAQARITEVDELARRISALEAGSRATEEDTSDDGDPLPISPS